MAAKYMKEKKKMGFFPVFLLLEAVLGVLWLLSRGMELPDLTGETRPTIEHIQKENTTPTQPDLRGIPESLVQLMEHNPETREFVLNYPNRQELPYDLTRISRATVPLFLQWDQRWGYTVYGTDVLALTGCGPTCMAMAGYYLTGDSRFDPAALAAFAESNDYYAWGKGTKWTFFSQGAAELGLQSKELMLMESAIVSQLREGRPVVVSVGPGDFTDTGHFILLVGYEDGMFRVNDPNSVIRSEQLWSYETLEPQIRNLWALWVE